MVYGIAFLSLLGGLFSSCAARKQGKLPQVILKLDDAWFEGDSIHQGWVKTFDYLNSKNIPATIGLVGERMEGASPAFYHWLEVQANAGHELWNHGYCHCKPIVDGKELREFRGTGYQYQLEQLRKTQAIAADKLGITLVTFGAPYNACDDDTELALREVPEIATWLYPPAGKTAGKHPMPRIDAVNIEYPVHQPDFAAFVSGFRAHIEEQVLVIQGHPRSWMAPESRMAEFRQIVDFLIAEGVHFTTPAAYRKTLER